MDQLDKITDDLIDYIQAMHRDAEVLTFGGRRILATIFKSLLQLLIAFRRDSHLGKDHD